MVRHGLLGKRRLLLLLLLLESLLLLLLLIHHLLLVAVAIALGQLLTGSAFLYLLGRLWGNIDGANGLSVGVEGGTGVFALIPGPDGLDGQRHDAAVLVVAHLMLAGI